MILRQAGFIGDGSSGRLSWLRMEKGTQTHTRTRVMWMMEWKMFSNFSSFARNFYASKNFHLTTRLVFFSASICTNVPFRWRIGWILIYHCLIISPLFCLSSRFKSISLRRDCYLMFFSGFALPSSTSCCRYAVVVVSLLFSGVAFWRFIFFFATLLIVYLMR